MELTFIPSMNKEEPKEFLAGIVKEALADGVGNLPRNRLANQPDNEQMVTVNEAATITGLAVNTIYDKTHRREIPHYKKGKHLYFRPSELLAWIANGRVMTQGEIDAKAISHVMGHPADANQKRTPAKAK
jgi:excisionase family DNA binding protein